MRGVVGVVTDSAYRDSPGIAETGLAAYARGMNAHTNKTIHHSVDIQQPIACGGVSVFPGDIIVGDSEGVVVIPRHLAEEVAEKQSRKRKKKLSLYKRYNKGQVYLGSIPPMKKPWLNTKRGKIDSRKGTVEDNACRKGVG